MTRDADVPQQEPAEEVQYPQERGALYDLPKVSSNDLVGEVIDILGFYGPFKSSFTTESGKEKQYVVFRFKPHSQIKYVTPEGTKGSIACGDEASAAGSAFRIVERIVKAGRPSGIEGEEVPTGTLRSLVVEEKTQQGFKVRTLKAPPSDWSCATCGATGPAATTLRDRA